MVGGGGSTHINIRGSDWPIFMSENLSVGKREGQDLNYVYHTRLILKTI